MKKLFTLLIMLSTICLFGQESISGKIIDSTSGEPMVGATVIIEGTSTGTITDLDGAFSIMANPGDNVVISYIGFDDKVIEIIETGNLGDIGLMAGFGLEEIVVSGVIDLVKDRQTPVASSLVSARDIQLKLGNQEFTEIMKLTPSIYTTKTGGGYGDGRINVRGFDQRNTSVIINGQPVNDMENGWVYWSNWAGLQDVASGVEIQRGIGASKLAVPSVGGTINIVTKTTDKEQGGFANIGVGNDGYLKTTLAYDTGELDNGFSAGILLGRWQGNGYVDGTEGEGYNYLLSLGYNVGKGHKLNATFVGASQWHNQRDAWLSIRDYETFGEEGIDRKFNGDWGMLNGEEFTYRRNFYSKPIASINWDWSIGDNTTLATVLYGSWGRGGGTGPRGRNFEIYPFRADFTDAVPGLDYRNADGTINFAGIIANNESGDAYTGSDSEFSGQIIGANSSGLSGVDGINTNASIRRASINSHNWYGAITNLEHRVGNLTFGLGLDGRTYSGLHYRILNDLLGLDGYASAGDNNNQPYRIITETAEANPLANINLDEKLNYFNIGNVKWLGVNGLVEYGTTDLTAVVQAGVSNQSYQREDTFRYTGDDQQSDTHSMVGGFVKGGLNYNFDAYHNVFANAGYIARQPLFDAVFPNFANDINDAVENEQVISYELGYGLRHSFVDANVNLYSTTWTNRWISRGIDLPSGEDGTATFSDVANNHVGVELDVRVKPTNALSIRGMLSLGNWVYAGDTEASVFDEDQLLIGTSTLYLEDVKVGDAAQTTGSVGVQYKITEGLSVDADWLYFDNLYADFDVSDDEFLSQDNKGAVQLPSYNLLDAGLTYELRLKNGNSITLRGNINNILDTEYIAESNTNIHLSDSEDQTAEYKGISTENFVWFGFGRTWNASVRYNF